MRSLFACLCCLAFSPTLVADEKKKEAQPTDPSKGQSVEHQGVRVRLLWACIEQVYWLEGNALLQFGPKRLKLYLNIANLSDTKKLNLKGWGKNHKTARVADNFKNTYKAIGPFRDGVVIRDQLGDISLYPEKQTADLLVFEAPVKKAKELSLELDASNYGGKGVLKFKIPRSWVKDRDPTEKDFKEALKPKPKPKTKEQIKKEAEEKAKRDAEEAESEKETKARREKAAAERMAKLEAARKKRREQAGASMLSLAKRFKEDGDIRAYRIRLELLVKKYPGTKAAAEAQKLLKKKK
jgi:hypothetical protein